MAKSYAATWRSTSMYYLWRKHGMVCDTTGERLIYIFRLRRNLGPMAKKTNFLGGDCQWSMFIKTQARGSSC
jgi:hypothetical protein